jgi:chromate transporter
MRVVSERPSLAAMGWQVAKDGNRTLGGGMASIELMRRSFAKRGWLDDSQHGLLVAVSRFTPGTNVLAYCAGLGWLLHRGGGAAVALAATSLPGSLAVTLLSAVIARLAQSPTVRVALAVAMLVAAALILSSAWALVRPYVTGSRPVWAAAVAIVAAALSAAGIPPVRVLLVAAIAGALLPAPPKERA